MVGELIAQRYELEELVGTGGMSSVYRAQDSLLERHVALKVMHQQLMSDGDHVERFRREARLAAQLSHPNIVTVIDRGEQDGRQFIVFEYVEGENLKALNDDWGPRGLTRGAVVVIVSAWDRANEIRRRNTRLQTRTTRKSIGFCVTSSMWSNSSITR